MIDELVHGFQAADPVSFTALYHHLVRRLVRLTPMYWPLGHVQHVRAERPSGGNDTLLDFCYNRRTNLFVTYSEQSITLWSSEVSSEVG